MTILRDNPRTIGLDQQYEQKHEKCVAHISALHILEPAADELEAGSSKHRLKDSAFCFPFLPASGNYLPQSSWPTQLSLFCDFVDQSMIPELV